MAPAEERLSLVIVAHDDALLSTVAQAAWESGLYSVRGVGGPIEPDIDATTLDVMREGMPDVIAFEANLPGGIELEVTRRVRLEPSPKRPFVVFVIHSGHLFDHARADRAGADAVFVWRPYADALNHLVSSIAELTIHSAMRI